MILFNFKKNAKLRYTYSTYELGISKNMIKNHISFLYINSKKDNIKAGSRLSNQLGVIGRKIEPFLEYCNKMGVDYWNFLDNKNGNYEIYEGIISIAHKSLDLDKYGLSAKYIIENVAKEFGLKSKDKDAIKSDKNLRDLDYITSELYNGIIDGNVINYSVKSRGFFSRTPFDQIEERIVDILERHHSIKFMDTYSEVTDNEFSVVVEDSAKINFNDRKLNAQAVDLFNTGIFEKYDVKIIVKGDINKEGVVIKGKNARVVANDLIYFVKNNQIPCIKCEKLVDNAFMDYGIQFDKHGGCI